MGVDGVSQTWQEAVAEDVASFVEPIPSDSVFDLPADVAEAQAALPADFDPTLGSMVNGTQMPDTGGDILNSSDALAGVDHSTLVEGDDSVATLADGGAEVADGAGDSIFDSVASGAESALETAGEFASSAADVIGDVASSAADVAGSVASGAVEIAGSVVSGAAEVAGSMFD